MAPSLALAQAKPALPSYDPPHHGGRAGQSVGQVAEDGSADQAYMQAMQGMHEATADMKPSGDADRDFVTMMIPHHQAAVDMAKAELRHGRDPGLKAMARDIVRSQEREIRAMRAWQRRHGR